MRIAVIGTGISGLGAAWLLSRAHDIRVFEREPRAGGHSHTVVVPDGGSEVPVDTGFIVYNERTYPLLTRLFRELDVPTRNTDMSFGVRCARCGLEYASSAAGLFADPGNAFRPAHWRMIGEMFRFFREAPALLDDPTGDRRTLGEWLAGRGYDVAFTRHFLLPLGGAVWSASLDDMNAFPARYFVQFFANHGFLGVASSPEWKTVRGGSREYVARLVAPLAGRLSLGTPVDSIRRHPDRVEVRAGGVTESYDQVVLAVHADDALALLVDASPEESRVLSGVPYTENETILHTDTRLLPRRKGAWASWNIHLDDCRAARPGITMTYDLTRLQDPGGTRRWCVSLNSAGAIAPEAVVRRLHYRHPHFTVDGLAARAGLDALQGERRTWYCGAWTRFGFHEDGLMSGVAVAGRLGVPF